jgi:DNA polymerase-3 subunit delta
VKITASRVEGFLRRPDPAVRAVLVYGPDAGLVRERADAMARHAVEDLADPFRVVELTVAELKDDPARLADEAASMALTGGRRLVRLRQATDALASHFEWFLDKTPGDALVVVEAGELSPRSPLRRLFEGSGAGAALPCYADEGAGLRRVIEDSLAEAGYTIEPDARAFLETALGADRMATRAELEKLRTYMGGQTRISLADAEAVVGDGAATTLDGVALSAASGDLAGLERMIARAWFEGIAPVAMLRAMARHLQRLHRVSGAVANGARAKDAMKKLRPPVHFRIADALEAQTRRWPPRRIERAMEIVLEAELDCKTTGMPVEAVCGRAMMRVARAAGH